MTTIRQIITDAFREAGIIEAEETVDAPQFEEALRRLQNLYSSLFGAEMGEPLLTVNYGHAGDLNSYGTGYDEATYFSSKFVPSNARLVFNASEAVSLYLNPQPDDGCRLAVIDSAGTFNTYPVTLKGNGRQIESAASITLSTADTNSEWFYRADLAQWVKVTDLAAEDESPLPKEFDDLLITMLAFRIGPRYGAQTSDEMVQALTRMRRIFRARYHQKKEVSSEPALLLLSSRPYLYWTQTSSQAFDSGRP